MSEANVPAAPAKVVRPRIWPGLIVIAMFAALIALIIIHRRRRLS